LDGQGDIYVANSAVNAVEEVVLAYLSFSATSLTEGAPAGTGSVSVQVLPTTTPWTATSGQTWLKITSTSGGTISFSFTANTAVSGRAAQITVLGQQVTVNQSGDTAASMAKTAGSGQTAVVDEVFATNLEVHVEDAAGKSVVGAPVTFSVTAGASGATAAFASSPPMPILTNSTGYATAPVLTAGAKAGTFTVTATTGGVHTKGIGAVTGHSAAL
jgi:hypothetical protein